MPLLGDCPIRGDCDRVKCPCMLRGPMTPRAAREFTHRLPQPHARRASASACASCGSPPASRRPTSPATASRRSTSRRSSAARRARRPRRSSGSRCASASMPASSQSGVSADERAKAEAILARAEALLEERALRRGDRGVHAGAARRARHRRRRAPRPRAERRGDGARAERRRASSALGAARARHARSSSAPSSPTSTAPTCSTGSASAGTCFPASRPRSVCFNEALVLAERSGLPSDELRLEHLRVALALLPPPARLRGRARGRRARARARRGDARRARARRRRTSRRRSLAERDGHWVLARTYAEKAKAQYEELTDRAQRRPAAQQPRRPRVPARQARAGGRAPEACVRRRARARPRRGGRDAPSRRSPRCTCAPATSSAPRSRRCTRSSCIGDREDMIDEIGNARLVLGRALLEQDRLDEAEVAFGEADDAFAKLVLGLASCRRVDRPGRPRHQAWRRTARSGALPPCSRDAPGLPVLEEGRCSLWQTASSRSAATLVLLALIVVSVMPARPVTVMMSVSDLGRPR